MPDKGIITWDAIEKALKAVSLRPIELWEDIQIGLEVYASSFLLVDTEEQIKQIVGPEFSVHRFPNRGVIRIIKKPSTEGFGASKSGVTEIM